MVLVHVSQPPTTSLWGAVAITLAGAHRFRGESRIAPARLLEVEAHPRLGDRDAARRTGLLSRPEIAQALDAACLRANVVVDLSECTSSTRPSSETPRTARRLHQLDGVLASQSLPESRSRRALDGDGRQPILPVHENPCGGDRLHRMRAEPTAGVARSRETTQPALNQRSGRGIEHAQRPLRFDAFHAVDAGCAGLDGFAVCDR